MKPKLIRNEADHKAALARIEDIFSSASKGSEVLSGKRNLNLTMIRNLVNELGIPADILLQEPEAKLTSDAMLEQGRQFTKTTTIHSRHFSNK